jgi:hypothetical protein
VEVNITAKNFDSPATSFKREDYIESLFNWQGIMHLKCILQGAMVNKKS